MRRDPAHDRREDARVRLPAPRILARHRDGGVLLRIQHGSRAARASAQPLRSRLAHLHAQRGPLSRRIRRRGGGEPEPGLARRARGRDRAAVGPLSRGPRGTRRGRGGFDRHARHPDRIRGAAPARDRGQEGRHRCRRARGAGGGERRGQPGRGRPGAVRDREGIGDSCFHADRPRCPDRDRSLGAGFPGAGDRGGLGASSPTP